MNLVAASQDDKPFSLEADQQAEEKDPEQAHCVPVPGRAVDDDLAQLDAAENKQRAERRGQHQNAEHQAEAVRAGVAYFPHSSKLEWPPTNGLNQRYVHSGRRSKQAARRQHPELQLSGRRLIACFGYLALSFTGLLIAQWESKVFSFTQPVMLGELVVILWLIIVGTREQHPSPAAES
jgi:hypothetical protein